jgi:hypothetical protein
LRKEIFAPKCIGCHDGSGIFAFTDFSTYESIISYKKFFELPADGSDSRFVKALVSGSMPKNGKPLDPKQIEVVRQWVALGLPQTGTDVGNNIDPDQPCDLVDFKMVYEKVFEAKCAKCHDETSKLELQTFEQIKSHLKQIEWVVKNDKMPPKKPLDPDLKDLVMKWIEQGAPETVSVMQDCSIK